MQGNIAHWPMPCEVGVILLWDSHAVMETCQLWMDVENSGNWLININLSTFGSLLSVVHGVDGTNLISTKVLPCLTRSKTSRRKNYSMWSFVPSCVAFRLSGAGIFTLSNPMVHPCLNCSALNLSMPWLRECDLICACLAWNIQCLRNSCASPVKCFPQIQSWLTDWAGLGVIIPMCINWLREVYRCKVTVCRWRDSVHLTAGVLPQRCPLGCWNPSNKHMLGNTKTCHLPSVSGLHNPPINVSSQILPLTLTNPCQVIIIQLTLTQMIKRWLPQLQKPANLKFYLQVLWNLNHIILRCEWHLCRQLRIQMSQVRTCRLPCQRQLRHQSPNSGEKSFARWKAWLLASVTCKLMPLMKLHSRFNSWCHRWMFMWFTCVEELRGFRFPFSLLTAIETPWDTQFACTAPLEKFMT